MSDTYKVTDVKDTLDVTDPVNPVKAKLVTFQTIPEGKQGTVTVPLTAFNAASVHAAIEPAVAAIKEVLAL